MPWFFHCFATIDNFCLVFLQWLNETKIKTKTQKTRNQKNKTNKMTRPNSLPLLPPLGCAILFFFVSCFFGFLFSGSLLIFWRAKDLDLTLCQFSHFRGCKLAFGWFYYLLWACGSIRKQCKKLWQNAGITGGNLGGVGHTLGNFVCLCNLSKMVLNKCKNIGSQWMCRTDFDIDIVASNPWVNTCSNTLKDSLEKEWCISLKWVLPSTSAFLL